MMMVPGIEYAVPRIGYVPRYVVSETHEDTILVSSSSCVCGCLR